MLMFPSFFDRQTDRQPDRQRLIMGTIFDDDRQALTARSMVRKAA